ncbi:MAG: class I SAM-dependent methyltransferase [Candidatus Shapirobacteria bacterium]
MLRYIFKCADSYCTGLSPFYLMIYSIVVGLETKSAFEFGAGWSTRVILDALKGTGGHLYSISTDSQKDVMIKTEMISGNPIGPGVHDVEQYYSEYSENWTHCQGKSETYLKNLRTQNIKEPFGFVLHDGSHTEEVVYNDLVFILQKMKYNSVLLVHDVLHSHCGKGMRNAVDKALKPYEYEIATLPYGFGLSIIVLKDNKHNGIVEIKRHKPTSQFLTEVL